MWCYCRLGARGRGLEESGEQLSCQQVLYLVFAACKMTASTTVPIDFLMAEGPFSLQRLLRPAAPAGALCSLRAPHLPKLSTPRKLSCAPCSVG